MDNFPTPRQREILDALAELIIGKETSYVSGKRLRASLRDAKNFWEDIEPLCPYWAERSGEKPNDSYRISLSGLMRSTRAEECRQVVERLLTFLALRFRSDPDFQGYTWSELKPILGVTDTAFSMVDRVIVSGKLMRGAGGSFKSPITDADFVQEYRWGCPEDIEEIINLRTIEEVLAFSREVPQTMSGGANAARRTPDEFEYDVCLSFAGEDRHYVEAVAEALRTIGIRVFYDLYDQANLWGKDLYTHLDKIYRTQARYCVIFISQHYNEKLWTNHERRSAQARAFSESKEYVLPARFDESEIPGLPPTIGYIDLRKLAPSEFARLVRQKVLGGEEAPDSAPSMSRNAKAIASASAAPQDFAQRVLGAIRRLQSPIESISTSVVEVLELAVAAKDADLKKLCELELKGYESLAPSGPMTSQASEPWAHRHVLFYTSLDSRINIDHFGSGSSALAWMEAHPMDFPPLKILFPSPIIAIEADIKGAAEDRILEMKMPASSISPDLENPNLLLYCYAHSRVLKRIVDQLKAHLTARLLTMVSA